MYKITSLLNIRTEETKTAFLLIGIMLFSTMGYSLGGTGIEALYFARFGTGALPYLYMGLGIVSLFTSLAITGLLARLKRERMYVLIPFLAAIFLLLAWGLLFSKSAIIFPALWLGKESLNTIVSMIGWNTAGAVCDSRQAKRLFPLFNASRILGAVIGGLTTGVLVNWIGTQNLVLVWAISMVLVFWMSRMLMRGTGQFAEIKSRVKRRKSSIINEIQKGWDYVRRSELLRLVSVAAILFSIVYFSIALPFSKSVTTQYPDEKELAGFLGLFNGLSTAAAFITSIFFANRLYARFGIMNIILALPLIYLFGFSGLIIYDSFFMIVIFRFIQTLWLSGMADAAYQTMFSAVPSEKRDQVNAFLNGVPEQAGVFLAGGILIIGEQSFTSQQLYLVGLITAIATTFVIWRATPAYRKALVSSLQEGRPTIFDNRGTTTDSTSLQVAIENIKHTDPIVRRVSAEMLSEMNQPQILISTLQDEDTGVRLASLKGLINYTPALHEVSTLLSDPEPAIRQQAIHTLTTLSTDLQIYLEPLLKDKSGHVQIEAAFGLLKISNHPEAFELLKNMLSNGLLDERIHVLRIMPKLSVFETYDLIANQINDSNPAIRSASAIALTSHGEKAIPILITTLADEDSAVRESAAQTLSKLGSGVTSQVISVLNNFPHTNGALIALSYLPIHEYKKEIKEFATKKIESALYYDDLATRLVPLSDSEGSLVPKVRDSSVAKNAPSPVPAAMVQAEKHNVRERFSLLKDSLHTRAEQDGIHALQALNLLNDRESIQIAIENLKSKSATQRANALETLESISDSRLVKPLLHLWETSEIQQINQGDYAQDVLVELLKDEDPWIRACAVFANESLNNKGEKMETRITLSVMYRVLLLRHVPLFADLSPVDLQRIASLSSEQHAEKDEVIFEQGEIGEEMYVIVHGEVKIMLRQNDDSEKEFARRKKNDVVGEMSIISGEPRIASLIAAEETHFLCLDKKSFEGLIRERPEIGFAVMRVLCERLKEATK